MALKTLAGSKKMKIKANICNYVNIFFDVHLSKIVEALTKHLWLIEDDLNFGGLLSVRQIKVK